MKILHISKYYYPFLGGVEQVARDCVNALAENEQKVFCFNHEKGNKTDEVDGVEIIRAGCFAKIASQSLSFSYGKLLKKVFKEFQPDKVIFHYPNPFAAMFLLKLLKKYPGCKLILYWHLDITKQKVLGKLFEKQNLKLLKIADKIVATSPNYIEGSKYLTQFKEKCVVIPNCFAENKAKADEEYSHEIRSRFEGKIICFALGRHVPYKGMEYLIRASKLLDDRFVVLIGGQGELTDSLKHLASDDKKVEFLGKLSDKEVGGYLASCDIFCFPSITKNEAFGIALAEAMAIGKPCVTFTIVGSGVNYVSLNGITGIEVENGNIEQYAHAILTLGDDDQLRKHYGDAAEARAKELFTFKKFKENINLLIGE